MIYTIKNKDIEMTIDSFGAEALSIKCKGVDYLRTRDEVWNKTAPILWPIVGRLKDKWAMYDGKKLQMEVHGFLSKREWKLLELNTSSITFSNKYDTDTLSQYPFKYEAYVTYALNGKNVETKIKIKNIDEVSYKYNIGGHPGFKCPIFDGEEFEDYRIVFNKKETFASPSIVDASMLDFDHPAAEFIDVDHIDLDYKYFAVDAIVNKNLKSSRVCLLNKNGKGIAFTWKGFNTLAFWTRPGSKFICFEPWKGYADLYTTDHDFLKKPDLVEIKPNEEKEVSYNIEIL